MDDHFHGTHVAGTIGAVGNNGVGISGVNWHVQIMALKFLDASGGGYTSDAIAALNYAVANGAVVSNNSWGGGGFSSAFQTAIQNAANQGHIFVAAAGNDGWNNDDDPFYPAGYNVDNVISVAATDNRDALAYFSNYGVESVDLAAPGVGIYSTFPTRMTNAMREEGFSTNYETISGTSMATPHVAGVAALYLETNPSATPAEVSNAIVSSATQGVVVGPGSGSPNRLLFSGLTEAPPPNPSPSPSPTPSPSPSPSPSPTPPPPGSISLTATGSTFFATVRIVTLSWTGATGQYVDVYRNNVKLGPTANSGSFPDVLNTSGGTFVYKVCQQNTTVCSNTASVTF
jgi:subtilisin family serine protease